MPGTGLPNSGSTQVSGMQSALAKLQFGWRELSIFGAALGILALAAGYLLTGATFGFNSIDAQLTAGFFLPVGIALLAGIMLTQTRIRGACWLLGLTSLFVLFASISSLPEEHWTPQDSGAFMVFAVVNIGCLLALAGSGAILTRNPAPGRVPALLAATGFLLILLAAVASLISN